VLVGILGSVLPMARAYAAGSGQVAAGRFVPVAPRRLVDTRVTTERVGAGSTITVTISEGAAAAANAVVVNLTAVSAADPGFMVAYAAGTTRPNTSNLNISRSGQTVASLATVPLDTNGRFTIYSSTTTDLLVDLYGTYQPVAESTWGRLVATSPTRVLDTRLGRALLPGERRRISLSPVVPIGATAVVLNATATGATGAGYFTLWPAGSTQPDTSSLNVASAGDTVANQAIVPVSGGAIEVYSGSGGDLLLDVNGYFTGPSDALSTEGLFVPVRPERLLDTRGVDALNPIEDRLKPRAGFTLELPLLGRAGIPASAAAVILTETAVHAEGAGFSSVWPAGTPRPEASTLNTMWRGQTVANHVIARVSERGVALFTSTPMHLVADVTGWYTGNPVHATLPRPLNELPSVHGGIHIPAIGIDSTLGDGVIDEVLDEGPMHWSFSSLPGELGSVFVLGHRTSHGGPFLRIGELVAGDAITLTNNGTAFTYRVTGHQVMTPAEVLGMADPGSSTLFLVACHPIGGTSQRMVVRAELI
jgi:LPXTG-site transpeptidase (sortase) family protein